MDEITLQLPVLSDEAAHALVTWLSEVLIEMESHYCSQVRRTLHEREPVYSPSPWDEKVPF